MNKKLFFSLLIGIIISGAALYLAFRNVPFTDLSAYLTRINYWYIIPTVFLVIFSFVLRALRWQLILSSTHKIGFINAYHPLMIGFMINCILPGRVGEIARPAILKKNEGVPFSEGLATVAVERVFDMIILILLLAVLFYNLKIDPDLGIPFGKYYLNKDMLEKLFSVIIIISILFMAAIIVISLKKTRDILNHLIQSLPHYIFSKKSHLKNKIQEKIGLPLIKIIENVASGFSLIKKPSTLLFCLILSLIIWLLGSLPYYIFSLGCPGIELSYPEMTAVMLIICVFIGLPSVPGFWGVWEAGGVFAMIIFGVSLNDAAGFTLANHAIQMIPVIIVGLVSAFITGAGIFKISINSST